MMQPEVYAVRMSGDAASYLRMVCAGAPGFHPITKISMRLTEDGLLAPLEPGRYVPTSYGHAVDAIRTATATAAVIHDRGEQND